MSSRRASRPLARRIHSKGVQLPDGEGPIVAIRDFLEFADLVA